MNYTEPLTFCKSEIKNIVPTSIVIIFFIIVCALGIDIHTKCTAAKSSKLYNNLREALNYGLASGITTLLILLVMTVSKGNTSIFGLMFSVLGVITGGMTIGLFYKCVNELSGDRKKTLEGFMWMSLLMSVLGGGYSATRLSN